MGATGTVWTWTVAVLAACSDGGSVDGGGPPGDTASSDCPAGVEVPYDGLDNDCDPLTPDDDLDGDGWTARHDCDDLDPDLAPGRADDCDGVDDDCDGDVDEDAVSSDWFEDGDGDGFGVGGAVEVCQQPKGYAPLDGDCDDTQPSAFPGAPEVWYDGVDQDCLGGSDDDADLDGWDAESEGGEDCDDTRPEVSPDALEVCGNGLDDNCDAGDRTCGVEGTFPASEADALVIDSQPSAELGIELVVADVDLDGQDDLVLGQEGLHLLLGPFTGARDARTTAELTVSFSPSNGRAPLAVGDVTGDGAADLLTGDASAGAGEAYLIDGTRRGSILASDADTVFVAPLGSSLVGSAVALLPDVDGDGGADAAIGAAGSAEVFVVTDPARGGSVELDQVASLTLSLDVASGRIGLGSAMVATDADGDGVAELLIGSTYAASVSGPYGHAAYLVDPALTGDHDVLAVASAVYDGSADGAGADVADLGDVDGDGRSDQAIGAYLDDTVGAYAGAAYVITTPPAGTVALDPGLGAKLTTTEMGAWLGVEVSAAGDLDGDGFQDLLVGAPAGAAGAAEGRAYLVPGPVSGTLDVALAATGIFSLAGDAELGHGLGAGDLDGDEVPDLALGAPYAGDGGEVWLLFGVP